jgi:hypothetical protein
VRSMARRTASSQSGCPLEAGTHFHHRRRAARQRARVDDVRKDRLHEAPGVGRRGRGIGGCLARGRAGAGGNLAHQPAQILLALARKLRVLGLLLLSFLQPGLVGLLGLLLLRPLAFQALLLGSRGLLLRGLLTRRPLPCGALLLGLAPRFALQRDLGLAGCLPGALGLGGGRRGRGRGGLRGGHRLGWLLPGHGRGGWGGLRCRCRRRSRLRQRRPELGSHRRRRRQPPLHRQRECGHKPEVRHHRDRRAGGHSLGGARRERGAHPSCRTDSPTRRTPARCSVSITLTTAS